MSRFFKKFVSDPFKRFVVDPASRIVQSVKTRIFGPNIPNQIEAVIEGPDIIPPEIETTDEQIQEITDAINEEFGLELIESELSNEEIKDILDEVILQSEFEIAIPAGEFNDVDELIRASLMLWNMTQNLQGNQVVRVRGDASFDASPGVTRTGNLSSRILGEAPEFDNQSTIQEITEYMSGLRGRFVVDYFGVGTADASFTLIFTILLDEDQLPTVTQGKTTLYSKINCVVEAIYPFRHGNVKQTKED